MVDIIVAWLLALLVIYTVLYVACVGVKELIDFTLEKVQETRKAHARRYV